MRSTERATQPWQGRLRSAGEHYLHELSPLVCAADPDERVAPRSRHLCAALGLLSRLVHDALGGGADGDAVGLAGAALSLLTKVDDEVIDSPSFHGGLRADRRALRARTVAYLAPTLASLRSGLAATSEPRCALAADVGRRLQRLSFSPERLAHALETIAEGWQVQVEAVATLTAHPAEVGLPEVALVTRRISGAWLLMIALVGTLPGGAARLLSEDEEAAFHDWGFHIQRADALADLEKDHKDGLLSTFAGRLAWEREPSRYLAACARGDAGALFEIVARHRIDEACLRGGTDARELRRRLAGLGEVHALLGWIHGFLLQRYLCHPLCRSDSSDAVFQRFSDESAARTDEASGAGKQSRQSPGTAVAAMPSGPG